MKYPKLFWLSIIGFIAILVKLIIYQFSNPDMTNTRIFLNMWPWYIPLIIFFLLANLFQLWKK